MKTLIGKFLFCLLLLALTYQALPAAEYDTIENDSLHISGDFTNDSPRKVSQADRLKAERKRLERQNEILVKQQIEKLRYQRELKMMKDLNQAFNKKLEAIDSLN